MQQIFWLLSAALVLSSCSDAPPNTIVLQPGQVYVLEGETIYGLAKTHDVSVRNLVETNHLKAPYILEEGHILTIPAKASQESESPLTSPTSSAIPGDDDLSLTQDDWHDLPPQDAPGILAGEDLPEVPAERPEPIEVSGPQQRDPAKKTPRKKKLTENVLGEETASETDTESKLKKPPKNPSKKVLQPKKAPGTKASEKIWCSPVPHKTFTMSSKETASFATQKDETVVACRDGVIIYAGKCEQFHKDPDLAGKSFVFISHPGTKGGDWSSVYLGVRPSVKKGQKITQGTSLGEAQGSALRFQLRKNRIPVNPKQHLK